VTTYTWEKDTTRIVAPWDCLPDLEDTTRCVCKPPREPVAHDKTVQKPSIPGSFRFIMDPDNTTAETDESNNECVYVLSPVGVDLFAGGGGGLHLHPVAPNPFSTAGFLRYDVAVEGWVQLRIYDVQGRSVRSLVDEFVHAGSHLVRFDGKDEHGADLSRGLYFARLSSAQGVRSRKILVSP
jgi:hypothetical protein